MSDEPIDLIRRMPNLYYALEESVMVGSRELSSDYEHELRKLAGAVYDALAEAINGCKLGPNATKRAVVALETLRQAPAKRARINAAARVLMAVPREGTTLGERRAPDLEANLAAGNECINTEATAARTLVELLHTKAA